MRINNARLFAALPCSQNQWTSPLLSPVIQFERLHALKLAGVVGDQRAVIGQRMAGNPQVIGTNRRARCAQPGELHCIVFAHGGTGTSSVPV